ncbi:MAG: AmmeMemoRadiSam system protein B [Planctomycetes bacterium]|nr:AmmeMemoRadiSam system protein B [Planctomycetota bacterium]
MSLRSPAVAGSFYPKRAQELRREVEGFVTGSPRVRALAVVAPHAGYRYSGPTAGAAYSAVEVPQDVVILAFNHGMRGAPIAVWPEGGWTTPLGEAPVNADLARRIRDGCPGAEFDEAGHIGEHSAEVQVPFLQVARPDVRIVPVALSLDIDRVEELEAFGRALAAMLRDELVVCSTDLNHYEDEETTLARDRKVIEPMERLDARGLVRAIAEHGVTMCGFAPAIATLAYARARGATRAETIDHRTSAAASGDRERCVGYVGMVIRG